MSKKSKGINAERELTHQFWKQGWACVRVSGSGSMQLPLPDLLVGNSVRRLAIECKTTKKPTKYFTDEELENLKKTAQATAEARDIRAKDWQSSIESGAKIAGSALAAPVNAVTHALNSIIRNIISLFKENKNE